MTFDFIVSLFLFWQKGRISIEKNFFKLSFPNTFLKVIPLGSTNRSIPVNQISNVESSFRLDFKTLIWGIILLYFSYNFFLNSVIIALLLLIYGIGTIVNAFETTLEVHATSGAVQVIPFVIFEKDNALKIKHELEQITNYHNESHDLNIHRKEQIAEFRDIFSNAPFMQNGQQFNNGGTQGGHFHNGQNNGGEQNGQQFNNGGTQGGHFHNGQNNGGEQNGQQFNNGGTQGGHFHNGQNNGGEQNGQQFNNGGTQGGHFHNGQNNGGEQNYSNQTNTNFVNSNQFPSGSHQNNANYEDNQNSNQFDSIQNNSHNSNFQGDFQFTQDIQSSRNYEYNQPQFYDQYGNPMTPQYFDYYGNPVYPQYYDQYGNPIFIVPQFNEEQGTFQRKINRLKKQNRK